MVSTKMASSEVFVVTLAFLRFLIGIAVLLVPLGFMRPPRFLAKDSIAIAVAMPPAHSLSARATKQPRYR
jgi:hypothetical protein